MNEDTPKSEGFCPHHGVVLELRQGKYGDFFGCPRYASDGCKYVFKPKKTVMPQPLAPSGDFHELVQAIKELTEVIRTLAPLK